MSIVAVIIGVALLALIGAKITGEDGLYLVAGVVFIAGTLYAIKYQPDAFAEIGEWFNDQVNPTTTTTSTTTSTLPG